MLEQDNMKVCAIIVTYKRPELLMRLLDKIRQQSISTDILIWDNDTESSLYSLLLDSGYLSTESTCYFKSTKNIGCAGGFNSALTELHKKDYDYFWLMDDDGYPLLTNCLSILIEKAKCLKCPCIVGSLVVNDASLQDNLTFYLNGNNTRKEIDMFAEDGILFGDANLFNGTLITKSIIGEIGYPKAEYFVYGEEVEYVKRALRAKITVVTAVEAIYYHPSNSKYLTSIKLGQFHTPVPYNWSLWKRYVFIRNKAAMAKEYTSKLTSVGFSVFYVLIALLNKKNIGKHFITSMKAWRDGIAGDFSKNEAFPFEDSEWRIIWRKSRQD